MGGGGLYLSLAARTSGGAGARAFGALQSRVHLCRSSRFRVRHRGTRRGKRAIWIGGRGDFRGRGQHPAAVRVRNLAAAMGRGRPNGVDGIHASGSCGHSPVPLARGRRDRRHRIRSRRTAILPETRCRPCPRRPSKCFAERWREKRDVTAYERTWSHPASSMRVSASSFNRSCSGPRSGRRSVIAWPSSGSAKRWR